MIKNNYRVYAYNADNTKCELIKISQADKPNRREEAIACAKMWAKYSKPGETVRVYRYDDNLPVEFVKGFKKIGER